MNKQVKSHSRREFIGNATALGVMGAFGAGYLLKSCQASSNDVKLLDQAPDGPLLKAGLIGCGGRGIGAAFNYLNAGPNLKVTAIADLFQERVDQGRKALKERFDNDIPDENCFLGFDAYKRVIDSDVDVVLDCTLAPFRPIHFEAAVQARKHVFLEKPGGADPVGIRSLMSTGKMAEAAGLTVVSGTQRRHQRDYVNTCNMVKNGAIGDIVSAECSFLQPLSPQVRRQPRWSDMEAMIRNRTNWIWLSGDVVVTLLVHQIDVMNWFFGDHAVKATGFGGRARRPSGDMYDFFSVDFALKDGRHFHGKSRQFDGCTNGAGETVFGTKGYTNCVNQIFDYDGNIIWEYQYPLDERGQSTGRVSVHGFDQEMINLVTAIRTNNPINQANNLATATMVCIMGRESAYTGRDVTWEEMMNSNLKLGPEEYKMGSVDIKPIPPVPGTPPRVS